MRTNILFIEAAPGFGGSSACLYNILKYRNTHKFNYIVCFYKNGPDIELIKELGVKMYPVLEKPLFNLTVNPLLIKKFRVIDYFDFFYRMINIEMSKMLKILKIIRKERINIVHINTNIQANYAGVIAARIANIPCINHNRNLRGKAIKRDRVFGKYIDAFIAISDAVKRDQVQNWLPAKRLVRIYDGIDVEEYNFSDNGAKIRKEFGIPPQKKIVGYVSRIVPGKGHLELIEAVSHVLKDCPETIFLIVGGQRGGEKFLNQCKSKITTLGINGNVIFTGWRTNIPDIMAAIDLFVHVPTFFPEGLAIVTLEAMASGKPTVVTTTGGLPETTVHKVTGFIISPGDTLALSKAILTLLKNARLSKTMGQNGRKRVEEQFNAKIQVKKIEEFYTELLGSE